MATKLKNLKVSKVDFVDEGANPDAHIKLFKRKDGEADGAAQEDRDTSEKSGGVMKRLLSFIAKAAGIEQSEFDSAMEEIEKSGAVTFGEQMNERKTRKIADEIWDICFALESSLVSIMRDDELDSSAAQTAMQESLDDFCTTVQGAISQWSAGKAASIAKSSTEVTESDLEVMKSAVERLNDTIEKASKAPKEEGPETIDGEKPKGEDEDMKIDKSKLTPAEKAFLEEIEKRYGTDDGQPSAPVQNPAPAATQTTEEMVAKALQNLGIKPDRQEQTPPAEEGIYKGMSPEAKAELEALKKFKQDTEDAELHNVAKRYEVLGQKEDDLFPVLKSLKASSVDAYNMMVKSLDSQKEAVEKSGLFTEIGKSGHGAAAPEGTGAWAQAEQRAAEIMKSKNITKNQALDEVFVADPALARKCEEEG